MYRKIVIGFDDGERSSDALALGTRLAATDDAEVVVAGIRPPTVDPAFSTAEATEEQRKADAEFVARLRETAEGIGATAATAESTSPARGLSDLAEELGADLIVLGSTTEADHGRLFAGHLATQVLQGAPCAVAVAPAGYGSSEPQIRTIGVGVDGSDESSEALNEAVQIARATGASLRLMSATISPTVGYEGYGGWGYGIYGLANALGGAAQAHLDAAAALVPGEVSTESVVLHGDAALELVEQSKDLDLLCVGSRAFGPVRRVLLGSVSSHLTTDAACPLLVAPRGVSVADGEGAGDQPGVEAVR
jgi:nucleotide-binding universal stress UspA family protein